MEKLTYKIIKTERQYHKYCNILEALVTLKKKTKAEQDTIELLTLLIVKWDEQHNTSAEADPVELLRYLMNENNLKSVALAKLLEISPSLVSDILNYRRGLSKDIVRKLSARFKVSQELFNRPYKLVSPYNSHLKDARVMNTTKKLQKAS